MADPRVPSPTGFVTFTAPCPACGETVAWRGTWREPGGGTTYRIDCEACTPRLKETA